ncbi:MAG: hypothetical protein LBJ38_03795 [Oscillospiraceae bacterium]|nr:hypothetical protein [Oscillospiraceae bacterium]
MKKIRVRKIAFVLVCALGLAFGWDRTIATRFPDMVFVPETYVYTTEFVGRTGQQRLEGWAGPVGRAGQPPALAVRLPFCGSAKIVVSKTEAHFLLLDGAEPGPELPLPPLMPRSVDTAGYSVEVEAALWQQDDGAQQPTSVVSITSRRRPQIEPERVRVTFFWPDHIHAQGLIARSAVFILLPQGFWGTWPYDGTWPPDPQRFV